MDWAQLLVYTLAILFAIFLVLAIVLLVIILKISKQIKSTTASAERAVHALEDSANKLNRTALPLALTKSVLGQVMKRSNKRAKKTDNHDK